MGLQIPELWILRHGEIEWNVAGRLQGHLDSPLTETGLAQARAQRDILARILPGRVPVLSSPSGRAWRCARIIAEGLDLPLSAEAALREIDIGAWHGRRIEEIRAADPARIGDDPHLWKFAAPGGESMEAMVARLDALLARLEGPTVLVTHGVTSRVLRCLVLGRPPEELAQLPGGQGVVHHLRDGRARLLG